MGARAERVPDCSSYLSRIPWSAADSRLSIHPRDSVDRAAWAVSPRKRVSCLIERQRCWRVDLLAGGLEAFPLSKLLPEPDLVAGGPERNLSPSR